MYSDYVDAPEGEGLTELRRLADDLEKAQSELLKAEAALSRAQKRVQELSEEIIPDKMIKVGLDELRTPSGFKVELKETVHAHISLARQAAAFRWLEENGHGGIIKRQITVEFNKNQEEPANDLHEELRDKFSAVTQKKAVHAGTLKGWVRRRLEEGEEVPLDLFGVHTKRVAKIVKS